MRPLPLLGLMVSDHFIRSDLTTGANWVKSKEAPYNPDMMMINLALILEDFISHIRCLRVTTRDNVGLATTSRKRPYRHFEWSLTGVSTLFTFKQIDLNRNLTSSPGSLFFCHASEE